MSPRRLEEVVEAAKAIEDVMRGEPRWNATIVADRLLSRGYVIRHVPPPPDEHTTDTDYCWCQPRVEDVPPDGRVIIHRRTADGPE